MSVLQTTSRVCLFCYKTINFSVKTDDSSVAINKFIKILNRFVKTEQKDSSVLQDGFLDNFCDVKNLFECCTTCSAAIVDFCEVFQQLKIVEMRLDWKLDKIAGIIDHANKVPTRWINFNKAFEDRCQDDLGKKVKDKRIIRELRQSVVCAANQRNLKSEPRVHLKRIKKQAQSTQFQPSTSEESTYLISNETTSCSVNTKPTENLVCQECGKKSATSEKLRIHVELHNGRRGYKWECGQCGIKFPWESKLIRHLKVHLNPNKYPCQYCGLKFSSTTGLTDHLKREHGNESDLQEKLGSIKTIGLEGPARHQHPNIEEDPLRIETKVEQVTDTDNANNISGQLTNGDTLNNSMKISAHNKTCLNCNKTFSLREQLRSHITSTLCSGIINLEKFPCKICGTEFRKMDVLKTHMEYHKSPDKWNYECNICNKMCPTQSCLSDHLKVHEKNRITIRKSIKCGYCDKKYTDKRCLNQHVDKVHWKEIRDSKDAQEENIKKVKNKFECKICGRKFSNFLKNQRHFRIIHGNLKRNEKETFKCTMEGCNAYFLRRAQVQVHLRKEHGQLSEYEKKTKLKCRFCHKGYNSFYSLSKHLKNAHSKNLMTYQEGNGNKKLFKCKYCENRYSATILVDKHVDEVHSKEKDGKSGAENREAGYKFKCEICNKRFSLKSKLETHFNACHDLNGKSLKETFNCGKEGCGAFFLKKFHLNRHLKKEHGIFKWQSSKHIKCGFCTRKFVSRHGLNNHLSIIHRREVIREKDRYISENVIMEDLDEETDSDYERNAIECIIRQEREDYLGEQNEESSLEDGESKELLSSDEIDSRSKDKGDKESLVGNESNGVHCKSTGGDMEMRDDMVIEENQSFEVEVKHEAIYEVILNKLEIGEDEEENYDMNETGNLNEVSGEEDANTFGRNMEYLDDGTLAELEDLD